MSHLVPFNDLERIHAPLRSDFERALQSVLRSQRFILGPDVEQFEAELAAYCSVKHAVGTSSGTDALTLALAALGVGPDDEVIAPAFSYVASASAAIPLGARPVFCDIELDAYSLCPDALRRAITPRTRAIIAVHLFGRVGLLDDVMSIAHEAGVPVVEDAAQAIGAEDARGRRAGSVGAIGCYSFFPAKNLGALGDGGACVTQDASLADQMRLLRQHGGRPKYHYDVLGGNWRLDALQAAFLRVKLPHLDAWTAQRAQAAALYRESITSDRDLAGRVHTPDEGPGRHVHNQFTVRVHHRHAVRRHMEQAGVPTMVYYPEPLSAQPCFRGRAEPAAVPRTDHACATVLSLPLFPGITRDEQLLVVKALRQAVASVPAPRLAEAAL